MKRSHARHGLLSLLVIAACVAGRATASSDDPTLPPPPKGKTPASAMRLPNLPPLGGAATTADDAGTASAPAGSSSPAANAMPITPTAPVATTSDSPAARALRLLEQRTGLSDAQLAKLQSVKTLLASGNESAALASAQALTQELDRDARDYIVGDGQNLFSIAGRNEVYQNSNLWPLLWTANRSQLREPWQLVSGMHLKVPAHPTVDQVSAALAYSRTHTVLTTRASDADLPAVLLAH